MSFSLRYSITRRNFLRDSALAGAFAASGIPAVAQPLSGKTVRWIVPFSSGGGYDVYSRLIQPFFEKETGARVVVDNVPGAGGRLGALELRRGRPDGLTLGILSASGMLVAGLSGEENAPDLLKDFTLFARLCRNAHVWASAASGGFHSFHELLAESARRPVLFTINELGSTSSFGAIAASHVLGLRTGFVAGYPGSVESVLAAIRGEVDLTSQSFETLQSPISQGDLRPLLQIGDEPISDDRALIGVPLLGGENGIAALRARDRGEDPKSAIRDASSIAEMIGEGRVVAGPVGMATDLKRYLEEVFTRICASSPYRAAAVRAGRSVEYATGESVLAALRTSVTDAKRFVPIILKVTRDIRNGIIPK